MRVEFRYDETTPEGRQISSWLALQVNKSEAIRNLILAAMNSSSMERRIILAMEQAIDRKVRGLVTSSQVVLDDSEDAELAAKLDEMF